MIQRIDRLAWEEDAASLADLAKQLIAERDELRAALKRYATHRYSCDWDTVHAVCTCGLDAALEAKEER